MIQTEIKKRADQAERFTIEQVDANWQELKSRTDHNENGYNSISELGTKVKALIESFTRPTVIANDTIFTLVKHPDNNDPQMASSLQQNDYAVNGLWSATEFWALAQFIKEDPDDKDDIASWKRIRYTDKLTTI